MAKVDRNVKNAPQRGDTAILPLICIFEKKKAVFAKIFSILIQINCLTFYLTKIIELAEKVILILAI